MNWSQEEKTNIPPRYGCEILLEDTSIEIAKNPTIPPMKSIRIGSIIDDMFLVVELTSSSKNSANFCKTPAVSPVSSPTSTIWMTTNG